MAKEEQERSSEGSEVYLYGSNALSLAVLKEAIECLRGLETHEAEERQLAWRAKRWIESDDWGATFSFNNVCASLKLDPGSVRKRILDAARNRQVQPKLTYSAGRRTKVRGRSRHRG